MAILRRCVAASFCCASRSIPISRNHQRGRRQRGIDHAAESSQRSTAASVERRRCLLSRSAGPCCSRPARTRPDADARSLWRLGSTTSLIADTRRASLEHHPLGRGLDAGPAHPANGLMPISRWLHGTAPRHHSDSSLPAPRHGWSSVTRSSMEQVQVARREFPRSRGLDQFSRPETSAAGRPAAAGHPGRSRC